MSKAVDQFTQYNDLAFSESFYATWAKQNQNERLAWKAYASAVIAGSNPAPPKLTTKYGQRLVLGGVMALYAKSLEAGSPVPPPPPPPGPGAYDKLFTGGDFDAFIRTLVDGQTGALAPGVTGTLTRSIRPDDGCAQTVTITSADPAHPATIAGRIDVRSGCPWVFDNLYIKETAPRSAGYGASWVIAAPVLFRRCDMTNNNLRIGLITNAGANGWKVSQSRIHHCGSLFSTQAEALQYGASVYRYIDGSWWVDNQEHGVYMEGLNEGGTLDNSIIESCSDRGIQFRQTAGAKATNVLIQDCGDGIIFGDMTVRNCLVTKSILRNNKKPGRYLVESVGSDIAGCVVDDNYIYNDDGRTAVQPGLTGVQVTNTRMGTPAAGYGPQLAVGPTA